MKCAYPALAIADIKVTNVKLNKKNLHIHENIKNILYTWRTKPIKYE